MMANNRMDAPLRKRSHNISNPAYRKLIDIASYDDPAF
jgi:hypothetical protein